MRILLTVLVALLFSVPTWSNDLNQSSWSETDGSNTAAVPNGWAPGMLPTGVEPTGRAMMGAEKRFYNHINCTATTTGSPNAQVVSYAVAPQALVAGDTYCLLIGNGLSNTGPATLNINSLGAKPVVTPSGAPLASGSLIAGQYVLAVYDGGNFRLETINNTVNGPLTVGAGSINLDNNQPINWKDTGGTYHNMIQLSNANDLWLGSTQVNGRILLFNNGAQRAGLDQNGNWSIGGNYFINSTQIGCDNLRNAATSCLIDATNASNITTGTLAGTHVGSGINAGNITAGTLPGARLSGGYGIGNLLVSNSFGGGGGNIGIDNGGAYFAKDTGGNYRFVGYIDGANNVNIGDNTLPGVCFHTSGNNCATFIGGDGYYLTHGAVRYNSPNVGLVNTTQSQTYVAVKDDGSIFISANSGNFSCSMNSGSGGGWGCSSDARLKSDILPVTNADAVAQMLALKPVSFTWRSDVAKHKHLGFIAQDVRQVLPQLVSTQDDGYLALDSVGLIAPLVATVQAQQKQLNELSHRLAVLEAKAHAK